MNVVAPEKWTRNQILLAKHSAHVIPSAGALKLHVFSGGALCFSFGTHFNESYIFDLFLNGDTVPITGAAPALVAPVKQVAVPKKRMAAVTKGTTRKVEIRENVTADVWGDLYAARVPVVMKKMDLGPCSTKWSSREYFLQHVRSLCSAVCTTLTVFHFLGCDKEGFH